MEGKEKRKRLSLISVAIIIAVMSITFGNIFTKVKNKIDKEKFNKEAIVSNYMELIKSEEGRFTYINGEKKVSIYEGYASMSDFYYDVACVSKLDNVTNKKSYALIDKNEKEIVNFGEYDYITQYDDGKFYQVEKDGKQGVINYEGVVVVPINYSVVTDHKSGQVEGIHAFSCKSNDDIYHYFNDSGKEITNLNTYATISFYPTKNSRICALEINGTFYNSKTCEKICEISQINRFADNVITYEDKYEVYNLDLELVETRQCPNATRIVSTSYNNKYTIVEVTLNSKATEEETNNRFILYDENGKAIVTAKDGIAIHKINEKYFILKEIDANVYVLNEKGKEIFKADNHRLPLKYSDSYYISLPINGKAQYDFYTKRGKIVPTEAIRSELTKLIGQTEKNYMLVTIANKDSGYTTYIMFNDLDKIQIEPTVGIIEQYKNHILTSDTATNEVKIYNKTQLVNILKGNRIQQIGTYSIIKDEEVYTIVDLAYLNKTFSFNSEELVKVHAKSGIVELSSGFYDLEGNKI